MSTLATMEQALIQQLRAGFEGRVSVEALPAMDVEDLLALFGSKVPAIYVTPAPLSVEQQSVTVRWEVLVVAGLAGGPQQSRLGKPGAIGSYEMAWRLIAICAPGIRTCDGTLYMSELSWLDGASGKKLADKGVVCGSALLSGVVDLPSLYDEDAIAALDDLLTVRVNHDLMPLASPEDRGALLADETVPGQPDAQDDIPLEPA